MNSNSVNLIDNRDTQLFNNIHNMLLKNQRNAPADETELVSYQNIDFSFISLDIIESLMDLFTALEIDSSFKTARKTTNS